MRKIALSLTLRISLSLTICTSLLVPGVSLPVSEAAQGQAGALPVRARPNRPEGLFPNLDEIKNESGLEREPPAPIPSTVRAKRNQGKPWDGRRVGEPFTPGQLDQLAANGAAHRNRQSRLKGKLIRRAHARGRFNPPQTLSDSLFIQNFFNVALSRSPSFDENPYWSYHLRAGYGVGPLSLKLAAIEMGRTVFESASYAARNRTTHWYVYDLYKTYLMRDPDAGGWAMWEGLVSSHGREYVRRGFEESGEFATLMANIVPGGAGSPSASSLISAMVDPRNQPGNGMLTRDASWTVPLLSLPGRNGLDLGLSLSYSSMVWTRSGPYFYFDQDNGFPSPGFRLGFPTVQRKAFDAQTATNSYLLVTPSGHRVQLRQISATVYEATDSSYLQLSENGANLLVRSTNGTQLTFVETNNEYRCTQIKDRNGNYITVNYNALGHITTITDTLGRAILFNYDSNANLLSITQSWAGQPSHQWVSFGWGTRNMQHGFSNDAVIGTANGTVVPVVTQVALNDTSHFTFDYTNSLQVSTVRNYFGTLERNATTFTYQTASGDVPRLSSSSVSARNWSGHNNVPAQVTTQYSVDVNGACVLTAPDGTIYKEYYGTGWQKGLTVLSEVWLGNDKQKWTTTAWTQDNLSLTYPLNPRVTEVNVHGNGNRRRTTIHYDNSQYREYGLPTEVREYAADAGTVIRKAVTEYNLNQVYLNQRIIGLVSQVQLSNGSEYLSKTTYAYDDPARLAALPAAPTRHDTSYGSSFTTRGNVTSVSRWDVTDIDNAAKKLTSYTNYYTTGSPASATDPAGHQSSISYADSFSDSVNRNTFAYPTTLTDAGNFSSYVKYNFDFGATTRTESPAPEGQTQGAIQTMTYNGLGQLERITTTNNGAYTRFWHGAEFSASYTSVNNVADEAYSVQVTDGMGRVIGAVKNHPGSAGGFSLVNKVYDQMGRVWLQSNPTEVNSSWVTTGDDAAGINYTQQTYDWMGRPLVTTNPDLTTKTASYSGCGCAGGEVVTLTDEGTISGGVAKRRQQKIHSDVLGRTLKTEILNWQGGSPYSTTVNTYNARNQVTQVRQYAGLEGSSTYQDTTMTYDGYGRLKTQHRPEQQAITNNSASSDHTTFNYNADDTISYIVDARGAITNYTYNSRHLLTEITYDVSNIPAPFNYVTTTVAQSFAYDSAGNRTSMTDGTGTTSFQYNSLSQLSSETRYFAGPFAATPYTLSYNYNLAGEMTSLVLPSQFGTNLTYEYDAVGRLSNLTGSGYSYTNNSNTQVPVTSFLSNAVYRAWNDLKQMNTGSSSQTNFAYNPNLQPVSYNLIAGASSYTWNYQYYADGSTRMVSDAADNRFDKAYAYDHVGRMTEAYSGREARGLAVSTPTPDSAFRQSFAYNAFNQQVRETGRIWQREISGQMFSFTNNRRLDLMYDAAGHVIADAQGSHVFDAAGHRVLATAGTTGGGETGHPEMPAEERAVTYDGAGQPTRNTLITRNETLVGDGPQTFISSHTEITYYLRSTVLGGYVVGELNNLGQKSKQYIYAGGERLLEHSTTGGFNTINWQHRNPLTDSWIAVDPHGLASFRTEVDAHGRETGIEAPIILSNEPSPPPQTRSPSYLEMQGGATIEAESGMQLYEDVYLNSIFEDGNGPAEGGYDRLRALREFQLSLGVKFALSMSWLDLPNRENYEPVLDYVTPGLEGSQNGRRINHYQLKPGTQQRGKTGPSEKEAPQDPGSGEMIPARNLLAEVYHLLDDNRCFTFLTNLLDVARQLTGRRPFTYDGYVLARTVATQSEGGITFSPGLGGGDSGGDISSGTARVGIFLLPREGRDPVGAQVSYALVALHEFVHLAGGSDQYGAPIYSDYGLAEAAKILTQAPGYPTGPAPRSREEQDKLRTDTGNYWDKQLREHCSPTGG